MKCEKCGNDGPPIQKMKCYICKNCRTILGTGVYDGECYKVAEKEIKISDRLVVRLHEDGSLDEVVGYDKNGECEFHMEQMGKMQWWMRFYGTDERPLKDDLVVRIGPSGGVYEIDSEE